jgi:hypothetical protein
VASAAPHLTPDKEIEEMLRDPEVVAELDELDMTSCAAVTWTWRAMTTHVASSDCHPKARSRSVGRDRRR